MPDNQNPDLWKRKLAAFLHDPPDKCLDISRHEDGAREFMAGAGFTDEKERDETSNSVKKADHWAAAAERFVFPKGKCATEYNGLPGSCFIHPLSSLPYNSGENLRIKSGLAHEIIKAAVGGIESDDWQAKFFLYWRRWLENAANSDKSNAAHLAFFPADSRIPDHTIWNHMSVTSAFAGCLDENRQMKPSLLLFQLGPVQEFIAQARSTRDLWSGSYLLSWLIAHAIKAVTDQVGPDAVIFPSLRGNGIFDALHRGEIYSTPWLDKGGKTMTTWERMVQEKRAGQTRDDIDKHGDRAARWLLTPTLPNRFLVLVPEGRATELAEAAAMAVKHELSNIGNAVWEWIEKEAQKAALPDAAKWKNRWDYQLDAFPQTVWAVQPWLERKECIEEFRKLPLNQSKGETPLKRLQDMLEFGEKWLPEEQRDRRYYKNEDVRQELNNPAILWSAHYALVDAKLAARRNTRDFRAWNDPGTTGDEGFVKDSLSGKEESIGTEDFWIRLRVSYPKIFPASHHYGAINLVKRLWCRDDRSPYLREKLGITGQQFKEAIRFDSVQEVACKNDAGAGGKDEDGEPKPKNPYVAVLAMDGDEMGKWVSGEKSPEFLDQLSANARKHLEPILKDKGKTNLCRLLTPSYHLQFSEALANFSTWLAEPIVMAFDGQLVYSGGDDVLAMLPADKAIACAEALRSVFRGETPKDRSKFHLHVEQSGFVSENLGYPLIVPGPAADVSIGIAIGHCKAPLQSLVREAQNAEKTAKKTYGRGALAIHLDKRSGEIIKWGCKWDDGKGRKAIELMRLLAELSKDKDKDKNGKDIPSPLSGRFPYALAALLAPYSLQENMPDLPEAREIIIKEFEHVLAQQGTGLTKEDADGMKTLCQSWLEQSGERLEDFINLFLVETFINRPRGDN